MTSAEPITERRDAALADLDLLPTAALVERIADEDARVAPAVRAAVPALAAAVDAIVARLDAGGRLVYVGAGSDQVIAIIAGGPTAQATAQEAAEDDDAAGASDLAAAGVTAADAVVALSASGRTPYTLGAARAARDAGALVVAVVCAEGGELERVADVAVVALVGPEVVAG